MKNIFCVILAAVLAFSCANEMQFVFPKGEKGEQGEKGDAGKDGDAGKSIYDIWLLTIGKDDCATVECFIEAMKGENGTDGIDGKDGFSGDSVYEIWLEILPDDYNGCTSKECFIESLKGIDGEKGEQGEKGEDGNSLSAQILEIDGNWLVLLSDGSSFIVYNGKDGEHGHDGLDGKTVFCCVMDGLIKAYFKWKCDLPTPIIGEGKKTVWILGNTVDHFFYYCNYVSDYYLNIVIESL